jgi:hypothetical protein
VPVPAYVVSKDLRPSGEKETHVNHGKMAKVRYFLAHSKLNWKKKKDNIIQIQLKAESSSKRRSGRARGEENI